MFLFYFYCIYVLLWHINFPPGINKVKIKHKLYLVHMTKV